MKVNSNKIQRPHFRASSISGAEIKQRSTGNSSLVYGLSRNRNLNVKTFLLELSESKKKTVTTKFEKNV